MAYDSIEPLDAAGVILKGLFGKSDNAAQSEQVSVSLDNPIVQLARFKALVGSK